MASEAMAPILRFPYRGPQIAPSTVASMPVVGDVLTKAGEEWLVVEVIESITGRYATVLEPMERAAGTRADGDSCDELT